MAANGARKGELTPQCPNPTRVLALMRYRNSYKFGGSHRPARQESGQRRRKVGKVENQVEDQEAGA